MDRSSNSDSGWASRLALAMTLSTGAAAASAASAAHLWLTAERGVICGLDAAHQAHCAACYAAPVLILAAIAAWLDPFRFRWNHLNRIKRVYLQKFRA